MDEEARERYRRLLLTGSRANREDVVRLALLPRGGGRPLRRSIKGQWHLDYAEREAAYKRRVENRL